MLLGGWLDMPQVDTNDFAGLAKVISTLAPSVG